ncbi:MATE family efflux transporter [Holdemania massiliensis]|uniref:MATE family efflux transporter n=1 Tax=Holdemania massiliensis TaxID=1468449 RepID=UPI001F05A5EC|nr:MATE family efflux transporter [Holdemania massiliensis]MCH1939879.1 MATE family efflux transporter [Holdemania massiliensis]
MGKLESQEEKYKTMTEKPVSSLICRLAVPTIISMLVTSFYNMADTFFVARIGTSATAAVGVSFALMAIIQAFGFFCGHGSGNFISRKMGQHRFDEAQQMAATGFFTALMLGTVILVLGEIFIDPLCRILGATETILPYARQYLRLILIGAPYMTASLVLNNQLRFQGSAFYAMIGIASGAVLNIALDPLFIFVFDMGVSGAALATIISQLVGFVLLLRGTTQGGNLRVRLRNITFSKYYYSQIINGGMPSLCRQGLGSVATICLNLMAGPYGDAAIAAMSVVGRVMNLAASVVTGFGQGFQPVCGFNYGAFLYDRVKEGFWFCVKVATVILILLSVTGYLLAPQVIQLFSKNDPQVIAIGTQALRWQCLTFPLCGWITVCNMMLQTIGKSFRASLLAMSRQGLFFIPAVLLLPALIGIQGVEIAQPIADVCSFILAIPLQLSVLHEMTVKQREAAADQTAVEG